MMMMMMNMCGEKTISDLTWILFTVKWILLRILNCFRSCAATHQCTGNEWEAEREIERVSTATLQNHKATAETVREKYAFAYNEGHKTMCVCVCVCLPRVAGSPNSLFWLVYKSLSYVLWRKVIVVCNLLVFQSTSDKYLNETIRINYIKFNDTEQNRTQWVGARSR